MKINNLDTVGRLKTLLTCFVQTIQMVVHALNIPKRGPYEISAIKTLQQNKSYTFENIKYISRVFKLYNHFQKMGILST